MPTCTPNPYREKHLPEIGKKSFGYSSRERKEKMTEVKDPKIKLFGKTIELPETSEEAAAVAAPAEIGEVAQSCDSSNQDPPSCSSNSIIEDGNFNGDSEDRDSQKSRSGKKQNDAKKKDQAELLMSKELKNSNETPPVVKDTKALSANCDAGADQTSKTEDDQTGNSDEKTLKRPDKILPCPRCNSMDTKFCYFNNYNVNQPRHFCKNCQRYWTAGGTMRNVPVGAGRRKNKNAAATQFRHLTAPEALQGARVDLPKGIHHPVLSANGAVLAFSSDVPLCESMVSVLNIADKTIQNSSKNGFRRPGELGLPVSQDNGDDCSNGSSDNAASGELGKAGLPEPIPNCHPFRPQLPCFSGAPWPYPWHSVPWSSPASPPTFAPASFPFPFYSTPPPPYWGCAVPGAWNVPWVIPPIPSSSPPSTGPNSPTLGKHSRDDNILKPADPDEETRKDGDSEKCLWVPKTLRIDDPGEAAKSSIWATLGITNDRVDSVAGGGDRLFKAFQSQTKDNEKMTPVSETSTVLQANPAALSRSVSFHENL